MTLQMTLKMTLNRQKKYYKSIFPFKIPWKWVLHMHLDVFVKNDIFSFLTLKLTFDLEDDLE